MALGKDLWDSADIFRNVRCSICDGRTILCSGRIWRQRSPSLSGCDEDPPKLRELQAIAEARVMLAPEEEGAKACNAA